jgi:hypothetical protein
LDSSNQWRTTAETRETEFISPVPSSGKPREIDLGLIFLRWIFLLALILVFRSWLHNGFDLISNDRLKWADVPVSYDGVAVKRAYSCLPGSPINKKIPPQLDQSILGTPLRVAGVTYEKGLGTYSPSKIVFDLSGKVKRFSCLIGMDETADDAGTAFFRVFADGREIYTSPSMWREMEAQPVDLDVSGANSLCLEVEPYGNQGCADWLDIHWDRE